MRNIRTDLALEAHEMYKEKATKKQSINGVEVEEKKLGSIIVTKVKITSKEGENALGKPCGNYITLEVPDAKNSTQDYEDACHVLAGELRSITNIDDNSIVLVAGLGNQDITPDALGPKVVSKLMVTRHIFENLPEYVTDEMRSVCAVATGVLGTTGIETSEIIKGVVEKVKPTVVIAIDALASRRIDRIANTIQIADTGISPGSGLGNKRCGLNKETLGVEVIAIGIPTVVDASTIASDAIDMLLDDIIKNCDEKNDVYKMISSLDRDEKNKLVQQTLSTNIGQLVVTPKDVDMIIEKTSKIVANGINMAVHKDLSFEDIENFIN